MLNKGGHNMKNSFSNKILDSIEKLEVKFWWKLLGRNRNTNFLYYTPK